MNRDTFRNSPAVRDFVQWAGPLPWARPEGATAGAVRLACAGSGSENGLLASLPVRLDVARSKFVPRGILKTVQFSELPLHYVWRAPGMVFGDLSEASRILTVRSQQLGAAVAAGAWQAAQAICFDLLVWGGERNAAHGARPELRALGARLCQYLHQCDTLLRQSQAVLTPEGDLPGIPHFGSMWVKIYAIMSGTPIYDSRVAGAIATLVETWRIQSGYEHQPLPVELTFPAVANRKDRTVHRRYNGARDPGRLQYGAAATPARWAGATVRLGWLIDELLAGAGDWRMAHTLEAALFMAGYDCAGINPPLGATALAERASGQQPGAAPT